MKVLRKRGNNKEIRKLEESRKYGKKEDREL
jgi:hypothetical protein